MAVILQATSASSGDASWVSAGGEAAASDSTVRVVTNTTNESFLYSTQLFPVVLGTQICWSVGVRVISVGGPTLTLRAQWVDALGTTTITTLAFTPGGSPIEAVASGDAFVDPDGDKGAFVYGKGIFIPTGAFPVADYNGSASWGGTPFGFFSLTAQWSVAAVDNSVSFDNYTLRVFKP